jgi:hypothetical protein
MCVARTMLPRRIQPPSVRVDFRKSGNEDVGPTRAPSRIQASDVLNGEDVAVVEVDPEVAVDYGYVDLRIITGIVVSGFEETEGKRIPGGVNEFGLGEVGSIQVDLVLIRVKACDGVQAPVVDIIDEDVIASTTAQRIATGTAVQRIATGTAVQRIATGTAVQRIATGTAAQRIATGTAVQRITASTAVQCIVAGSTLDRVIAGAALDIVVAGASDEIVGIGATLDRVVAGAANYGIASGASHDRIIIATSPKLVVAGPTKDAVVSRSADDEIVSILAEQLIVAATANKNIITVAGPDRIFAVVADENIVATAGRIVYLGAAVYLIITGSPKDNIVPGICNDQVITGSVLVSRKKVFSGC